LTSLLRVELLGHFCVMHSDRPVTGIDNARLQSLLAYLVLHRDAPRSRAETMRTYHTCATVL
jgi:DNA-binding SARP family transcriptional activator